jgi:hypothetical protein
MGRDTGFLRSAAAIVLVALAFAGAALAGTFFAFGPEDFRPTGGSKRATIYNRSFSTPDPSGSYTLKVINGGTNGQFGRVSSCGVVLNGALVVKPSQVNQNVATITRTVTLRSSNTLQIQVAGNAGSGVTLQIEGTDTTPPIISATRAPAANASGWNNSNVTVTFTCSDARSGIATCTAPVTVSTEGAGQIVSGTATDKAGNTATASVTVDLDRTAPTIAPTIAPPPNAAGWSHADVTITYACADSLSGIQDCPAPMVVGEEGAGRIVSATATDRAGNSAAATATLNIDKTPPTIVPAAAPAPNANGWNDSDVTVTYTCADAISGVVDCPPPATLSGEGGGQVVTGTVTDRADNTGTATLTLNLDRTPPTITIAAPAGAVSGTTAPQIDVRYADTV